MANRIRRLLAAITLGCFIVQSAPARAQQPTLESQFMNEQRIVPGHNQNIEVTPAQPLPTQSPRIVNTPATQSGASIGPRVYERPSATTPRSATREPRLEFQDFVAQSLGRELPLFGRDLFVEPPSTFAPSDQIALPAEYVIGPGDEIVVRAWGQVDIDYRATVDRDGRIYIPKVGSISVAGVQYQNLEAKIRKSVSRVFKNFELNVSLGQLRSIQVFVVGQARRPGSYVVSSLSTLVNALFVSSGPSTKGSMRNIQLKRGGKVVTQFDLYDLILRGDKSKDTKLLPGDVIFIPPVGRLAAISGSVNVPAIYEIKVTTTAQDLIDMAGGLAATAAGTRITLERVVNRKARMVEELPLDAAALRVALSDGDQVHVYTLSPRIQNAVTLRGNVAETMRFPWKKGMRIKDVIPEADALIVPGYWIRKNTAGRADDWLRSTREAQRRERLDTEENADRNQVRGAKRSDDLQRDDFQDYPRSAVRERERRDTAVVRTDIVKGSGQINWDYAVIERFDSTTLQTQLIPFNLGRVVLAADAEQNLALMPGDIITVFSVDDIQIAQNKQAKYVRLEGEFGAPGVYQILPGDNLRSLIARAGGLTGNAYIYGAEFTRESTRKEQQQRLNDAIDRLEMEAHRAGLARAQGVLSPEDAQSLNQQTAVQTSLIAKLRTVQATGRIVLGLPANGGSIKSIPELPLEDGDRLYVPPIPGTVSVFGAVYNQNAYLYERNYRLSHYLELAGGPTKDADKGSIYLVRADGSVISTRQRGWLGSIKGESMMPGDAVVVPESLDRLNWTKELKDWTQILYQLALGVAGLKVLKDL